MQPRIDGIERPFDPYSSACSLSLSLKSLYFSSASKPKHQVKAALKPTMVRSLCPILQREWENLDKDANSRRSAMKALKSYVKDLDSTAIPIFLAQVSQTKETGSLSGECTTSLYEVLAHVQSVKIVPLINSIMTTIMKTLAFECSVFPSSTGMLKGCPNYCSIWD